MGPVPYLDGAATSESRKGGMMPVGEIGPTITAVFEDGPLEGGSLEVEVLEGRPPKTLEAAADDGTMCRYCLAGWVQSGRSARYTFLYRL